LGIRIAADLLRKKNLLNDLPVALGTTDTLMKQLQCAGFVDIYFFFFFFVFLFLFLFLLGIMKHVI
jgi:hypothetical protein